MIAPIENAMHAVISKLIGNICTAIAKNATRHMQLNVWADVFSLESSFSEIKPRFFIAMLVAEVLQIALAGLVADGAVERVIDEKEFNHSISCVEHSFAGDVLHDHSVHHIGAAACNELRHWARVGG